MKTIKELEQEIEKCNLPKGFEMRFDDWCDKLLKGMYLEFLKLDIDRMSLLSGVQAEATLTQTKEITEMIEERIKYCKSKLVRNFERDQIWKWRISGFEEVLQEINGKTEEKQ